MYNRVRALLRKFTPAHHGGRGIFEYIGPGLIVTVGFIDPGNWASNLAAGADFGYLLLWIITLATIMLVILQHNVAHLGIATGLCLSEATSKHVGPIASKGILITAMLASVSTSMAEILGAAIALRMLLQIPLRAGAILALIFVLVMLFTNTYRMIERWIIAFVSVIGLSFIYELALVHVRWGTAIHSWTVPTFPRGSMLVIMSVLGAVVMPHNLFLHSEIIQSRQWHLEDERVIKRELDFEFFDTLFSMLVGWAINSAMVILAAETFYRTGQEVTELEQAKHLLEPLLGSNASSIFAIALLFAGISSTITSGMAAGSIFAGMFGKNYDIRESSSRTGVAISLLAACMIVFFISNPYAGLIYSQMVLSIQLPITIFLQIHLTSSEKVMGKFRNTKPTTILLLALGTIVTALNIALFFSSIF